MKTKLNLLLLSFASIKYKSKYNNGRAYIMTGLKYSLDLASQRNIDDEGLEIVKLKKMIFYRKLDWA